jgi:hypothetical protein
MGAEVEHYPTLLHEPQEGVDYLHGILRLGEDTLVGLHGEAHACLLEPLHGIMLGEAAEHTAHELVATRIDLLQVGDPSKGVGDVAASAAGHREFVQRLDARLKDRYVGLGASFLDVDGAKNSRRATANYRYFGYLFQFFCFLTYKITEKIWFRKKSFIILLVLTKSMQLWNLRSTVR